MAFNIVTGIGTRRPPARLYTAGNIIGHHLGENDIRFRSGGALGMDIAFEEGFDLVSEDKEIWLPKLGSPIRGKRVEGKHHYQDYEAFKWACALLKHHGIVKDITSLDEYVQRLFARNVFQITGYQCGSIDEGLFSDHVIYAAEEDDRGVIQGGTRIAVYLARALDIPCYNLMDERQADNIISIFNLDEGDILPLLKPQYAEYEYRI